MKDGSFSVIKMVGTDVSLNDFIDYNNEIGIFIKENRVKVFPSNYYHGSFSDSFGNIYEEKIGSHKDLEKKGHFIEKD